MKCVKCAARYAFVSLTVLILCTTGCGRRAPRLAEDRIAAIRTAVVVSTVPDALAVYDPTVTAGIRTNRAVDGWAFREVVEDPVQRAVRSRAGAAVADAAAARQVLAGALYGRAADRPNYDQPAVADAIRLLHTQFAIDTLLVIRPEEQRVPDTPASVAGPALLRLASDRVFVVGALAVDVVDTASATLLLTGRAVRSSPLPAQHWTMCAEGEGPESIAGLRAETRDLLEAAAREAVLATGLGGGK